VFQSIKVVGFWSSRIPVVPHSHMIDGKPKPTGKILDKD
jgi:hypothetical protein